MTVGERFELSERWPAQWFSRAFSSKRIKSNQVKTSLIISIHKLPLDSQICATSCAEAAVQNHAQRDVVVRSYPKSAHHPLAICDDIEIPGV